MAILTLFATHHTDDMLMYILGLYNVLIVFKLSWNFQKDYSKLCRNFPPANFQKFCNSAGMSVATVKVHVLQKCSEINDDDDDDDDDELCLLMCADVWFFMLSVFTVNSASFVLFQRYRGRCRPPSKFPSEQTLLRGECQQVYPVKKVKVRSNICYSAPQ